MDNQKKQKLEKLVLGRITRFFPLHWATEAVYFSINIYSLLHYNRGELDLLLNESFSGCLLLTHMWVFNVPGRDWNSMVVCNAPAWSLSVEWIVNLVMFFAIRLIPIHFSILGFEILGYLGYYSHLPDNVLGGSMTAPLWYAFFFGVVFYKLTGWFSVKHRALQLVFDIFSLNHLVTWKEQILRDMNGNPSDNHGDTRFQIITYGIYLVFFLNNSFLMKKFLSNPIFRFFGTISFSVYLCHYSIIVLYYLMQRFGYREIESNFDLFRIAFYAVVYSTFMHYYFEAPVKEFLDHLLGVTDSKQKVVDGDVEYQKIKENDEYIIRSNKTIHQE